MTNRKQSVKVLDPLVSLLSQGVKLWCTLGLCTWATAFHYVHCSLKCNNLRFQWMESSFIYILVIHRYTSASQRKCFRIHPSASKLPKIGPRLDASQKAPTEFTFGSVEQCKLLSALFPIGILVDFEYRFHKSKTHFDSCFSVVVPSCGIH